MLEQAELKLAECQAARQEAAARRAAVAAAQGKAARPQQEWSGFWLAKKQTFVEVPTPNPDPNPYPNPVESSRAAPSVGHH